MRRFIFAPLVFLLFSNELKAESCDTNCHDQCGVKVGFVEYVDPVCHGKCELAKKAACARGGDVPNLHLTPRERIEALGNMSCTAAFEVVTKYVIDKCDGYSGANANREQIDKAIAALVRARVIGASEFSNVRIQWCPLKRAHGTAPDRNTVYLDTTLTFDLFGLTETLAHEMIHVRQYRSRGTDRFKCDYSRYYIRCGGCKDRRNPLEREAYEFGDNVRERIRASLSRELNAGPRRTPADGVRGSDRRPIR